MAPPTAFLLAALLLVAGVAVRVLRPVWHGERVLALALGALLLVGSGALYLLLGTPAALDPAQREAPKTLGDAIARLEAELRRDPAQAQGWQLLGRARAAQGDAAGARAAFGEAAGRLPDDADAQVEAAEARALADPRHRFDPQAVAMLRRALQLQPAHQRARWFLGISQRQSGDAAGAARTWEALLATVDAKTAASLRPQLDAARRDAGLPPLPASRPGADAGGIEVRVMLDPDFAARVRLAGDASVFVIARQPGGPPMPVAVERHFVQELPLAATLDDGDGPMPAMKLSALREVEVIARLSRSGNAMRQPGDIESAPVRIALPASRPVTLVLGAAQ